MSEHVFEAVAYVDGQDEPDFPEDLLEQACTITQTQYFNVYHVIVPGPLLTQIVSRLERQVEAGKIIAWRCEEGS
jgi:hypothetical protein